jgi:hypothetical protein
MFSRTLTSYYKEAEVIQLAVSKSRFTFAALLKKTTDHQDNNGNKGGDGEQGKKRTEFMRRFHDCVLFSQVIQTQCPFY